MRKYFYLAVLIATVQLFFSASAVAQAVTGWQLTGNRNADTLSFVGTTNGVPLRFATKNAARMVIDTLGNVGVGITKPKYPLDIAGKLRLADGTQGAGKVLTSDANGLTSWLTPASNPWTISGNNLYNINTGNIGIGMTTPTYKLDVSADSRINGIRVGKGRNSFTDNTATGANALDSIVAGTGNTANGYYALNFNSTGSKNTAVGANALSKNTTGSENTATGAGALQKNTTGKQNAATGAGALNSNTTGNYNVANGDSALFSNTTAAGNNAVGFKALGNNVTGNYNTALGHQALQYIKSGTYNTAIGYLAGSSGIDSAILTNATAIGANAKVTTNNSLVLGSNANVGIGTSAPAAKLDVVGKIKITDGSEQPGYVLTSDSTTPGLAKWKIAPGSLWTSSGANSYYSLGGNIGIGNNIPANKLSVGGSADFSGKVGVGTSTPLSKLQVGAKVIDDNAFIYDQNSLIVVHPTPSSSSVLNDPKTVLLLARQGTNGQSYGPGAAFNMSRFSNNGTGSNTRLDIQLANGGFMYNSNNVMTLLSTGNVGIGTTTPAQRLDISGNLQFSNATLPKSFMDEIGGTTPLFTMGSNFHEATKNNVYRGGAYRIDLRDGFALHQWYGRLPNSGSENLMMALSENSGLGIGTTFAGGYPPPDNGAIIQGYVGVGTPYASAPMTIKPVGGGNPAVNGVYAYNDDNSAGQDAILAARVGGSSAGNPFVSFDVANEIGWSMGIDNADNNFKISKSWNSLTADPKLTIDYYGQVGIGTTTPGSRLDVNGDAIIRNYLTVNSGATVSGYASLNGGATVSRNVADAWALFTANSQNDPTSYCNGIYIRAGSNTYPSGAKYHNFLTFGRPDGTPIGGVGQTGTGSVSYATTSDERLKTNIKDTKYGLDVLKKIQVSDYNYKESLDMPATGFIAQQLYKVYPFPVVVGDEKDIKNHPWMVDYSRLTPLLVKAVQEQQKQIDTKDETITKQQADIKTLQTQMALLMQKIDAIDARQEACCTAANSKNMAAAEQSTSLSSASLEQNVPNPPANNATRIGYNIPKGTGKAQLIIADNYGRKIKEVNLSIMGKGTVNVDTKGLAPGTYAYTLLIDGKMIDTKQMVVGQ